jgi:hypothetical protein
MFDENYVRAVRSSDLRDDAHHTSTEALFAAAQASKTGTGLGPLLARVKYADGTLRDAFASGSHNLARLLAIWHALVSAKGRERAWLPASTEWDISAQHALYRRVALGSLSYWIDPRCPACHGTGVTTTRRLCPDCRGSKRAELPPSLSRLERDKIMDMVSELEGLLQAHNVRAAKYLRRRA